MVLCPVTFMDEQGPDLRYLRRTNWKGGIFWVNVPLWYFKPNFNWMTEDWDSIKLNSMTEDWDSIKFNLLTEDWDSIKFNLMTEDWDSIEFNSMTEDWDSIKFDSMTEEVALKVNYDLEFFELCENIRNLNFVRTSGFWMFSRSWVFWPFWPWKWPWRSIMTSNLKSLAFVHSVSLFSVVSVVALATLGTFQRRLIRKKSHM